MTQKYWRYHIPSIVRFSFLEILRRIFSYDVRRDKRSFQFFGAADWDNQIRHFGASGGLYNCIVTNSYQFRLEWKSHQKYIHKNSTQGIRINTYLKIFHIVDCCPWHHSSRHSLWVFSGTYFVTFVCFPRFFLLPKNIMERNNRTYSIVSWKVPSVFEQANFVSVRMRT